MLSSRLVRAIEEHAEELTRGVLADLSSNPRTPAYHSLPRTELHRRIYDVYHNLGRWLGDKSEGPVAATYATLGRTRREERVPLSEVVQALILTKDHLWDYILRAGLVESPLDLYQEEELTLMLGHFFDRALYHTVRGYEGTDLPRRLGASSAAS
jgi:hypothetical protein